MLCSPSRSPPYVRRRSPSRDRVLRRSRSPPRRRQKSLSRDRGVPPSRSPSRDRVVRQSVSPPLKRRPSLSRDRAVRLSRSPYQQKRSLSPEMGGPPVRSPPPMRSPYRNRRSPSRDQIRRNGLDARDRDRLAREKWVLVHDLML